MEIVASSEDKNYTYIPKGYTIPTDADYFHITTNNTIYGTEIPRGHGLPRNAYRRHYVVGHHEPSGRREEVRRMIYGGGAQKNVGPAGVTFSVIVRKDLLWQNGPQDPDDGGLPHPHRRRAPQQLDVQHAPVFPIFVMHETLKWVKELGGLEAMYERNKKKAETPLQRDRPQLDVRRHRRQGRTVR